MNWLRKKKVETRERWKAKRSVCVYTSTYIYTVCIYIMGVGGRKGEKGE